MKSALAENEGMRELVTDAEDPRLADYARLTDMELRTRLEPGQGLFIAEGTKVISRAVAAGYPVRSVLVAEDARFCTHHGVDFGELRAEAKTCSKQRLKQIYPQVAAEIMAAIARLDPRED